MERIVLARVAHDTSLTDALKKFRPKTRAIVVTSPDGSYLLTAGDLMDASNDAVDAQQDPAKVPVSRAVSRHTPITFQLLQASRVIASVGPGNITDDERERFKGAFDSEGFDRRYLIEQVGSDAAVVVTASERFAHELGGSVVVCTCAGDPVHTFEQRQLKVPGKCNKPHGVDVTCAQVEATG